MGQKSRVLSVFQMIESEKYKDAKEAIELAVWNEKTSRWYRTYYAKGLLCQKAFEAGFDKGEKSKTNLYPDQLIVAYDSYNKALELNSRNKTASAITLQLYNLANDFQKLGEKHYAGKEYSKALQAFEHALLISKNPQLSVSTDTNLVYNTAVAAYEAREWDKAISYLTGLNDDEYSPNTALLLYSANVNTGDSVQAEQVLFEGMDRYNSEESIVLRLVDLLVGTDRKKEAVTVLDSAIARKPENYHFPWTRGLVYQQMELYDQAIESLVHASGLAPEEVDILYNIGLCYYNMGVEISEHSREIYNNREYQAARKRSREQLRQSLDWLEKAYKLDPSNQLITYKLNQLYYQLQMPEKQKPPNP